MRLASPTPLRIFGPLVLCVLTLIGCLVANLTREGSGNAASADGGDGPVDASDVGTACVISSRSGQYTAGMVLLRNSSDDTVEITEVRLGGAQGVKLEQSYLVPIRSGQALGNASQWPPGKNQLKASLGWKDRRKAVGDDKLSPQENGGTSNLVLHLSATGGATTSYDSVTVDYTADGDDFTTTNNVKVVVQPTC